MRIEIRQVQRIGQIAQADDAPHPAGKDRFDRPVDTVHVRVGPRVDGLFVRVDDLARDAVGHRGLRRIQTARVGDLVSEAVGTPVAFNDLSHIHQGLAHSGTACQGREAEPLAVKVLNGGLHGFAQCDHPPPVCLTGSVELERALVVDGRDVEATAPMLVHRLTVGIEMQGAVGKLDLFAEARLCRGIQAQEALLYRHARVVDESHGLDAELGGRCRAIIALDDVRSDRSCDLDRQRVGHSDGAVIVQ